MHPRGHSLGERSPRQRCRTLSPNDQGTRTCCHIPFKRVPERLRDLLKEKQK